jgi:hypothetical protein
VALLYSTETATPLSGNVVTVTGLTGEPVKYCVRLPNVICSEAGVMAHVPLTLVMK